ncbi:MAG TPA: helix-turn-helix transcriptional regulator [Leptospiraceae bacterium]|nr:helix-turn-helix transcriptional regulator [Leptospiraceae bacterium]HMW06204.1 helix-turn-helix transcriptional regulator [Leptospiraceae bacterium]HMX34989.1 helix-turn-helix transcriptional regulator [Leptospiraceae bacterium]HMY31666.1 helix-turn-helix transcriptional regulator [Leptospiraceae bacterium]HMZ65667.1 helix-turn-helix transcriptional regulator [Leptospiraceae bacterium]
MEPFDLTSREAQIIDLVIQGAKNKDISDFLCISENTVKTHLQNIYAKLDVCSKAQLVAFAFQNNISLPPDTAV